MVGDSNTLCLRVDWSFEQKLNKEIFELNEIINQIEFINIYKTFYMNVKYIFFSVVHGTFTKIDQISLHKASLKKKEDKVLNAKSLKEDRNGWNLP